LTPVALRFRPVTVLWSWQGCVDGVEAVQRERHGVGLVELLADVVRLRVEVNAGDVEPGELVAAGRPTGPAEQVEQRRGATHDASRSARWSLAAALSSAWQ
jgi:hypothetical protein